MGYRDFELRIKRQDDHYIVYVISAGGRAQGEFVLPFPEADISEVIEGIEDAVAGRRRRAHTSLERRLEAFGTQLFDALFQGEVRDRFNQAYAAARERGDGLRMKLNIGAPELTALPWEFMYNSSQNFRRFLALYNETPVIRYAEDAEAPPPLTVVPPLRVLGMVASPRGIPKLNSEREKRRIEKSIKDLADRGLVWIDWLKPATLDALRDQLSRKEYHIFHFIGHGQFDEREQEGYLLFEDEDGDQNPIDGEILGLELANHRYLRLVLLNACESAHTSLHNPLAGVAIALVQASIPAVVAMQFAISDRAAIAFSRQFYQTLSEMHPMEMAITHARRALVPLRSGEWGIPVIYLSIPGSEVFAFNYNLTKLQEKVEHLLDQKRWSEVIPLCTLMQDKHPRQHSQAQGLQLLARAHIRAEEQKWEDVLDLCTRGQSLIGDERFLPLITQATEEIEIAELYRKACKAFEEGARIEAVKFCDDILEKRRTEPRTNALKAGVKAEEKFSRARGEIEELVQQRDWRSISRRASRQLGAIRDIDLEITGVRFPNIDRFYELSDMAELHLQGQKQIAAGKWVEAEHTFQEICSRWPDLRPREDLLYAEARQLMDSRRREKAIEKLREIQKIRPDYRDVAQLLQSLEDEMKQLAHLYQQVEDALKKREWTQARATCQAITNIDPTYCDISELVTQLDRGVEILSHLRTSLVVDPLLGWEGRFPYDVFSEVGISPESSMEEVNAASYELQKGGMSPESRKAWDALRSVDRRIFVDAFLYPVNHWKRSVQFLEKALVGKHALPTSKQLQDRLGDDAPVILLLMGERESAAEGWEQLQRADPSNGGLALRLGLLYYWWAKDVARQGDTVSAQEKWRRAIGNWAIALEDDAFWQRWGEDRGKRYEAKVTEEHLSELRPRLEGRLHRDLTSHRELDLTLYNELASVRLLKKAGGLSTPERPGEKAVCGPVMLPILNLDSALAELVSRHSVESDDIVERLISQEVVGWSPQHLRCHFSQLSKAIALLDWDEPEESLTALAEANCGQCPPCDDPRCPLHRSQKNHPKVCCAACPRFDQLNPAYVQLSNKGRVLFEDAMDISIIAHLRLAEGCIARKDLALADARGHWDQAIALAEELGVKERVQEAIREKALGRVGFIAKEADQEGEDITWCNQIISITEAAIEVAGEAPELTSRLAKALTFRGVRRANWFDVVGSEGDLRRAFELNPSSIHTRHQFAIALKLLARDIEDRDRWTAAQLLREAEEVVRQGLVDYPEHSGLKEQLEDLIAWRKPEEPAPSESAEPEDPFDVLRSVLDKPSDLEKTIKDVEKAWRRDPTDEQLRSQLLNALIEYSDQLAAKGQYAEAAGELEKWLPEFPDDDRLRKQADFMHEGYKAEAYLRQTELKFKTDLWESHTFNLPFHSEVAPDVVVRLQVEGDVAAISSCLPSVVHAEESQAFLNLLQTTYQVPIHKFCQAVPEELSIVAEVSVSLLTPDLLERILRMTSKYVDIAPETLLSFEQLKRHFELEIMARTVFQPLEWLEEALSADLVPSLCRAQNIECKLLGDGRFSIRRGRSGPETVAYCSDMAVHFTVTAGPLKERSRTLYRRMAEVNAAMRVCKVTLDPHQNVVFMYEMPGLNEETLIRVLESLERYIASFGAELVK